MTVLTERTLSPSGLSRMSKVNACFGSENATSGLMTRSTPRGGLVIEKMPVFRAGTFKDSRGDQMTWEAEHLMQMVFNFDLLKSRGILPNVPVRDGHPSIFGGGGNLVGYIESLEFEQATGRLLATYELTEPDAVAKVARGTYRARSSEIGMYETNDEALYWPVFMGFAFVDIPAVEGLYSKDRTDGAIVLVIEEDNVAPKKQADHSADGGNVTVLEDGTQVVDLTQTENPIPEGDAPVVEPPAAEGDAPVVEEPVVEEPVVEPPAAVVPEVPAAVLGTPTAPATFAINGQPVSDFAAVQAHIAALEGFVKETKESNRKAFVTGLATSNKIIQPQVEGLTAFALSLDETQYEAFRASYEVAPTVPLLAVHANGVTNPDGDAPVDDNADERSILTERLALHRSTGMTDEQIARTDSAKRLAALNNQTKE